MQQTQEEKYIMMTTRPVERLIPRLAVPCIISMLITSFYNMADTFFVGRLGSNSATGAVGVVFSMMSIIQAVAFCLGQGSGQYISQKLGEKNADEASNMAVTAFVWSFIFGGGICLLGQLFLEELALFLGATPTILPHAMAYLKIILIGAPWMIASLVLNNQLRFQGSAVYGMVGITAGAVLNIILDPIFIFRFHMGVAGAGLATIISQFASFCLLLFCCSRGGNIHLHVSRIHLNGYYLRMIARGGLPSLTRQSLAALSTIALNHAAGPYGDAVIAAMGVVQRMTFFVNAIMIGFGQGFQPVCAFNYGAKLYHRVKQGFRFSVKVSFVFLLCAGAVGIVFAPQLVALFRDDPEVIRVGTFALRCQMATVWCMSWVVMSNMMCQCIGRTVPASFLAGSRQGIFFIPAALLLPHLFGVMGIQMVQSVSDLLALCFAVPIQLYVMKTMDRENR